jgi:hypothetical protein
MGLKAVMFVVIALFICQYCRWIGLWSASQHVKARRASKWCLKIDRWLKIFITAPTAVVSPWYRTQTHYNSQIWMMYWPSEVNGSFIMKWSHKYWVLTNKTPIAKYCPGPQRVNVVAECWQKLDVLLLGVGWVLGNLAGVKPKNVLLMHSVISW